MGSPESHLGFCFLPGTWKAPTLNWTVFEVSAEIVGASGMVRSSRAALKYSSDFGENKNAFVMSYFLNVINKTRLKIWDGKV